MNWLSRFEYPVADHGCGKQNNDRALNPNHGVDPFAHASVLLEKAWVHQIHATGPRHLSVDDNDLTVETQVGASDETAEESHGQGGPQFHARISQALRLAAFPPRPRAKRVHENSAGHPAPCCPDDGLKNLVGRSAFIPTIELHENAGLRTVHVARDGPKR